MNAPSSSTPSPTMKVLKEELPPPTSTASTKRPGRAAFKRALVVPLVVGAYFLGRRSLSLNPSWPLPALEDVFAGDANADAALCPQATPLVPEKHSELWQSLGSSYGTDEFLKKAVDNLGGAVRVPTESFDKMDEVGKDPRWEVFGPFHNYLLKTFPLVHSTLSLTKVNTYGLAYEWTGSDKSLKPLLLAAHQDVVPVDPTTVDQWAHPPFSGYFDGSRIWGRGSSDDKSGLIGILTTLETLISKGWKPTRTIVLSFGFDEEASGLHGASALGKYLEGAYGENAFAMIVDEGGGFGEQKGAVLAVPGIGEKGYLDTRVEVTSPGGHSSIPPPHTTIGILAQLLVQYEANPYKVELNRATPVYGFFQCLAAHAPQIPSSLKKSLKKSVSSDKALKEAEKELFKDPILKNLAGTTQAIDLIDGGVKTNALPERAWAVVNHRIATESSVAGAKAHDTALLRELAKQFNLSYTAFGETITSEPSYGTLTLSDAWGAALEPAPITPTGPDAAAYQILSGTIKATYNTHRSLKDDGIVVAPGIMTGNTDTRYYWKLTENIFRYNHHNQGSGKALSGVHTVNESIPIDAFIEMIRFFTTLILNVDESTAL
ncbi:carboxypeptidase S [Gloeophyllum trabeum ATCC 11539]|uniref:Carboxypeptidase S n=1 Tax=Gloeophyllum trabeum (strain ATCC 11539 / FP-39264 / Madison 617) TaxID=670483 RepID=S7QAQ2_GLOTA|nr:carboxypeptidase S [Gloeophyllum trabeum ATCC 11539]EPQ56473.1 carboxypeptidase S [Gloeophyllum trabeum ATCC 11539]